MKITKGHDFKNKGDYFECSVCSKKTTDWQEVLENLSAWIDGQRLCKPHTKD